MWDSLRDRLLARLEEDARIRGHVPALEEKVATGQLLASVAADELLELFLSTPSHKD
jgi:hypothetical protein